MEGEMKMKEQNAFYFMYGTHKKGYTLSDFNSDITSEDEQAKKRVEKQIAFYKKEDAYVKSHT